MVHQNYKYQENQSNICAVGIDDIVRETKRKKSHRTSSTNSSVKVLTTSVDLTDRSLDEF
jgi:hypothetical protein